MSGAGSIRGEFRNSYGTGRKPWREDTTSET